MFCSMSCVYGVDVKLILNHHHHHVLWHTTFCIDDYNYGCLLKPRSDIYSKQDIDLLCNYENDNHRNVLTFIAMFVLNTCMSYL